MTKHKGTLLQPESTEEINRKSMGEPTKRNETRELCNNTLTQGSRGLMTSPQGGPISFRGGKLQGSNCQASKKHTFQQ
jgi:hypothetical protein